MQIAKLSARSIGRHDDVKAARKNRRALQQSGGSPLLMLNNVTLARFAEHRFHLSPLLESWRLRPKFNWRESSRDVRSGLESGKRRSSDGARVARRPEKAVLYLSPIDCKAANQRQQHVVAACIDFRRAQLKRKSSNVSNTKRHSRHASSTRRSMWSGILALASSKRSSS